MPSEFSFNTFCLLSGEYRCLVLVDSSVEDIYYVVVVVGDPLFPLVIILNPSKNHVLLLHIIYHFYL